MLSSPLRSWLLDETSDAHAVKAIAASDLLRGEAAMMLPVLRQAALRPATMDEIQMILKPRFETLGVKTDRTPEQWAVWWADYADALEGLPAAAIEAGIRAYLKQPGAEFMPKPGKLRELASATPNDGKWVRAYTRAKAATAPEPVVKAMTDEDRTAVRAQVGDLVATLEAKAMAKTQQMRGRTGLRPTPSAKVDSVGVSDEMRRLLIRQGSKINPPASDYDDHQHQQDRAA